MADNLKRTIVRALKRSRVLLKQRGQDPDTGYWIAAHYISEDILRSNNVVPKPLRPGHKTGEMD